MNPPVLRALASLRTLMLGALATGRTRVRGILESADVHSTAGVLRTLGVTIPPLGADVALTSPKHRSGTDRVAEVARKTQNFAFVINIQGDEPLIDEPITGVGNDDLWHPVCSAPDRQEGHCPAQTDRP